MSRDQETDEERADRYASEGSKRFKDASLSMQSDAIPGHTNHGGGVEEQQPTM